MKVIPHLLLFAVLAYKGDRYLPEAGKGKNTHLKNVSMDKTFIFVSPQLPEVVFIPLFCPLYPLIQALNDENNCLSLLACVRGD